MKVFHEWLKKEDRENWEIEKYVEDLLKEKERMIDLLILGYIKR